MKNDMDMTYKYRFKYVMQAKLTLRMEESVIRKAKRMARQKRSSVSRMVAQFIIAESEDAGTELKYPPITSSMIGILKDPSAKDDELALIEGYKQHLKEKHS